MAFLKNFLWSRQVQISNTADASSTSGDWQTHASTDPNEDNWLSTTVTSYSTNGPSASFDADIAVGGNYTVFVHTPGCTQEQTCTKRGTVNITCWEDSVILATRLVTQMSENGKYDQVYQGPIKEGSGGDKRSFTIILEAAEEQTFPIEMVAQSATFNASFSGSGTYPSGSSLPQPFTTSTANTETASSTPISSGNSTEQTASSSSSKGLSAGAIAGIVIGSAAVLVIALVAILWFRRNRKHTVAVPAPEEPKAQVQKHNGIEQYQKSELHSESYVVETSGETRQFHEMPGREHRLFELSQPAAVVYEADGGNATRPS